MYSPAGISGVMSVLAMMTTERLLWRHGLRYRIAELLADVVGDETQDEPATCNTSPRICKKGSGLCRACSQA
jgi:hypothetical protein